MPTMVGGLTSTISKVTGPATSLPGARGALVLRGGYVITMDPATGDLPGADVLVSEGLIAAVGPSLTVPPACRELDAHGMVVAPGLVDTHWHMWNTLLRGMSESGPGYFRLTGRLGRAFGAEDVYHGTLLACAEAINSGITTVHDWCHNVRGPGHAEAGLRAHPRGAVGGHHGAHRQRRHVRHHEGDPGHQ